MSPLRYTAEILMLTIVLSCSVKEDRSACLCCLGLDYSECDDCGEKLVLIGWDEGLSESFRSVPYTENSGTYCEYYVPRCNFTLSASKGANNIDGMYVTVQTGLQADSLYAYCERFQTDSEYCYRKIQLNKQFTTVRIILGKGQHPGGDIIVKANTAGLSLSDLSPLPGTFSCTAENTSDGVYSFRLFRYSGNVTVSVSDKLIDLSRMLDACGYDWTEASLRDVDLYLDKAVACVSVKISGWDYSQTIHFEI